MPYDDKGRWYENVKGESNEEKTARESRASTTKTFTAPAGAAKKATGMPSMKDYPNDLPGYQAAVRKYRQDQAKDPTKSAVSSMLKEKTEKK